MTLLNLFLVFLFHANSNATNSVYIVENSSGEIVGTKQIKSDELCGESLGPQWIIEHGPAGGELSISCESTPKRDIELFDEVFWMGTEVKTLIKQGPSKNRIDLVIIGDGYTEDEKEKFFEDSQKITKDLFDDSTFQTYLPLFNVHAVFVPSNESGIGDGSPINTALELYRHPEHRQAIFPGNPRAARKAARLAPDVDYPILVANDNFYGGLGGEFAITTSAPLNITTVLRHELGHNFGNVGEEYDGGGVYRGANHSRSSDLKWDYFSGHENFDGGIYKAQLLFYRAPWKNLDGQSWSKSFGVPNKKPFLYINFSSLGFDTEDDVSVFINNEETPYYGSFNYDRNFYDLAVQTAGGLHKIEFKENITDGNNILSKVAAYALNEDYPFGKELIGGFATYNHSGRHIGYRPTDRACLMKDMSSRSFCPICIENMWYQFFKQVSLIDNVIYEDSTVTAKVLPLGPERLLLRWIGPDGNDIAELENQISWDSADYPRGQWTLEANFISDEIHDPGHSHWTTDTKKFDIW